MCGIGGVFTRRGPASASGLERMTHSLRHRGPDESSIWVEDRLGLAHTRLSIIDLAASHQPMHAVDRSWSVVFNGEIFNYRELREDLDYPFRTEGDTEVLVAGLVRHGIGFVERLRGQFSIAAYDHTDRTLHLVRDRLGVLPLYYRLDHRGVVFGSEIKAIHAYLAVPPEVDPDSLDGYLAGRSVPAPFTLFSGVSKLPPGHRAEIGESGVLRVHRYWAPPRSVPRTSIRRRRWTGPTGEFVMRCRRPWWQMCRWAPISAAGSTAASSSR